jgi:AraC-like DNA-binding protein
MRLSTVLLRLRISLRSTNCSLASSLLRLSINKSKACDASNLPAPSSSLFSEAQSWKSIAADWQQLYGGFADRGLSFEWHEFQLGHAFPWNRTFHPNSLELCLNIEGDARIQSSTGTADLGEMSAIFYSTGNEPLEAERLPNGPHRFITVEFSRPFLRQHLPADPSGLDPVVSRFLKGDSKPAVSQVRPIPHSHAESLRGLRQPPVCRNAQPPWYMSKALELSALHFFEPHQDEELFCHRQKLIARDRVEKVLALLRENLATPPTLQEISKKVGCSPFYLSRTFSAETGSSIPQQIRKLRMEKAAELLKSGKFNVTEAAFEVGYSSLSHFSQTFHETFGCCPGLYPLSFPIKPR